MNKQGTQLQLIDKPIYRYWSALFKSFYSRLLYIDVGKRWKGFGFKYLLFALACLIFPLFFKMALSLNQSFQDQIKEPLLKIPEFYIQNGEVIFNKPMPYLIKNNKNQVAVIIDTTGKVNSFGNEYPYLGILINKNKITFNIPSPNWFNSTSAPQRLTPMEEHFDKQTNLVFDAKKVLEESSISKLQYGSIALIYPTIIALFFSIFIVFFIVLAFLGQTFSIIFFSFKIKFKASCRLLIVAATPMLFFLFLMLAFDKVFPGSGIILLFLLMVYYGFGLFALRADSRKIAK